MRSSPIVFIAVVVVVVAGVVMFLLFPKGLPGTPAISNTGGAATSTTVDSGSADLNPTLQEPSSTSITTNSPQKQNARKAQKPVPPSTHVNSITAGPIISLDFDDGFESAYLNALPIIHKSGFVTTQYIITHALGEKDYVTAEQVLEMQAAGDEIGAHTQTHPHLTQIPLAQAQEEIVGSKQDLENMGIEPLTFAYPYGLHSDALENILKQNGFIDARITWPGYNDSTTDPYRLWYFGISASTTVPDVKKAIDTVAQNKKWLIIVFHRIDESKPDSENTTHQLVQAMVDYIKAKKIPVVTNAQGLEIMKNIP